MASPAADKLPAPSNVTERRQPVKKKPRLTTSSQSSKTNTPNAYARRSPPRSERHQEQQRGARSPSNSDDNNNNNSNDNRNEREGSRSPLRKLKRPGAGARIGASHLHAAETARRRREEEERQAIHERQISSGAGREQVANHYNLVPERGREWRKTDSQIKGLRSLNNWIKSTLIQKFSLPEEYHGHPLLVLDMACGKGGDLGKWEKAPKVPSLYVGCDIADVSVEQARTRWEESLRKARGKGRRDRGGGRDGEDYNARPMQAEFYVHDAFSRSLADIPRIRQVGFNPHAGPGNGVIQGGMMTGGFDVVSMMFALHYSYESEVLARGMLRNVAGALKKGGRFFGVMPNSDVVSATVKKLLGAEGKKTGGEGGELGEEEREEEGEIREDGDSEDDWDPEKPSEPNVNGNGGADGNEDEEDEWDPEKPSEPQSQAPTTNETTANGTNDDEEDDDWDPEKPSDPSTTTQTPVTEPPQQNQQQQNSTSPAHQTPNPTSNLPPLEWGNQIYTVRFPRNQPLTTRPLPADGIFRPPYGWRYHYHLAEAVDVPEYVVPWEAFRALAEEYGLELLYRKGFREVLEDEGMGDADLTSGDSLARLAERMGVLRRRGDGARGGGGGGFELLVGEEEMEAAGFYHAFCFYRT